MGGAWPCNVGINYSDRAYHTARRTVAGGGGKKILDTGARRTFCKALNPQRIAHQRFREVYLHVMKSARHDIAFSMNFSTRAEIAMPSHDDDIFRDVQLV